MKPRTYCPIVPSACEADAGQVDVFGTVLGGFQGVLRAAGRTDGTQRVYVSLARRWLEAGGVPGHFDSARFSRWLRDYRREVSAAQVNGVIKAVRAFYRAMAVLGHCTPGEHAKLPRMRRVPAQTPRYWTPDQVAALVAAPDASTWLGLRDRAVLQVLADTGVRASELVALNLGDLLDDGTLYVRGARRDRDRYVPTTPALRATLADWIARRVEARPGKRAVLFVSTRGRRLSTDTVGRIVATHARSFGLIALCGGRATPTLLRNSLAVALTQRGMPITAAAQLLGHADVATTARFVAADLTPLRAAVAHHPRARRSL